MFTNFKIFQAPEGFCPNCNTEYSETEQVQIFKGGKVKVTVNRRNSDVRAYVNNKCVGSFENVTVGYYTDILYSLQLSYAQYIN